MGEGIRLQKYLAGCGVAARRKCEQLIAEGRVMVNGVVSGEIRGTPAVTGTYGFTITVTDSYGCTASGTYSIEVS